MAQARTVLDTPIFHKLYDLYKLLHTFTGSIPRSARYSLWLKCENTILELLETVIEIVHRKGEEKLQALYLISDKVDLLKVFIRLAKDTRAIDKKQYLEIQKVIQEVGKMVGGWIKSIPQ